MEVGASSENSCHGPSCDPFLDAFTRHCPYLHRQLPRMPSQASEPLDCSPHCPTPSFILRGSHTCAILIPTPKAVFCIRTQSYDLRPNP